MVTYSEIIPFIQLGDSSNNLWIKQQRLITFADTLKTGKVN